MTPTHFPSAENADTSNTSDTSGNRFATAANPQPAAKPDANPPGTADGAHREADRLTRNRDLRGNRLQWFYSHSVATVADMPLAETALAPAVEAIRQMLPIRAAELHHFYDEKLRPAYRRLLAVRDAEEAELAAQRDRAESANSRADAAVAAETGADREALLLLDEPLALAHQDAGEKVARVGGAYDPADPSEACVLRHVRVPDEAVAAELRLPWTPADKSALLPGWITWPLTFLVGGMIGLSIGLMARWLTFATLGDRWLVASILVLVGFAAAAMGKKFVFLTARAASQRYWLERPWIPSACLAALVAGTLCVMDAYVEQEGLLAGMRLQNLAASLSAGGAPAGTGAGKDLLYFLAAMILTFGYVGSAACEGALHGRADACLNHIRKCQEDRFRAEDLARRAEAPVQHALASLAVVRDLLRRQSALSARIGAAESAAALRRPAVPDSLTDAALRRIQDAVDQLNGTQTTFDEMFAAARAHCERAEGFWTRLWRRLRGGSNPRQTAHEKKRPLR